MLNRLNFEIAALAPTDEMRFNLCGIRVSPDGTAVTDGHAALIVSGLEESQRTLFDEAEGVEPADFFSTFVLDRDSALKIAKALPKKQGDGLPVLPIVDATTEHTDRAMVSINDLFRQEIIRAKKMTGKYPLDMEKIFPDRSEAKVTVRLGVGLLLDVLKTVNTFAKGRDAISLDLSIYGPEQPVRIDVDGMGQKLAGLIMPMRGGGSEMSVSITAEDDVAEESDSKEDAEPSLDLVESA